MSFTTSILSRSVFGEEKDPEFINQIDRNEMTSETGKYRSKHEVTLDIEQARKETANATGCIDQ